MLGLVLMLSGSSVLIIGMVIAQVGNDVGNELFVPGGMLMVFAGMVAYAFSAFIDTLHKEIETIKKEGEQ